jgi:mycothiol system anti-sigma-R factor
LITCAEAVRQLWAYLDESLDAAQRERIEEHLGLCRQCCGELEFAKVLRGFLADHAASDQLPEGVRSRMQKFVEGLQS